MRGTVSPCHVAFLRDTWLPIRVRPCGPSSTTQFKYPCFVLLRFPYRVLVLQRGQLLRACPAPACACFPCACACTWSCTRSTCKTPTSWLLLPWQTSPPGKVRSDTASTPHRLRTSEIPMPKSDASLPSSACIAFSRLAPFHKTGTDFGGGKKLNFCTSWLHRFVPDLEVWYLNLKVSPTKCIGSKLGNAPVLRAGTGSWVLSG